MLVSKPIRLISVVILLFFMNWTQAALIGKGPAAAEGDLYPYTQTIIDGAESFDVQMDGTLTTDPATHLYVSAFNGWIGIMKSLEAPINDNGDYRQINADEEIHMTFSNIPTGKQVEISALSGFGGHGFLFAGLMVLIGATLVAMLGYYAFGWDVSAVNMGLTVASTLLFTGYILYDTSNVMRRYAVDMVVPAALALLIDFIIMFRNILWLLAASRD